MFHGIFQGPTGLAAHPNQDGGSTAVFALDEGRTWHIAVESIRIPWKLKRKHMDILRGSTNLPTKPPILGAFHGVPDEF
jgi:hypothetical protein